MRLLLGGSIEKINALGAGGRKFKSSRPDHFKQWVIV